MVNIMPKKDSNVHGYMLELKAKDIMEIEKYYKVKEDKDWSFMVIYDTNGNRYKGFTFICKNTKKMNWIEYPTPKMLKNIYSLFLNLNKKL